MWKVLGCALFGGGVVRVIQIWILEQEKKQKMLDELIIFLRKSLAIMQKEKIHIIKYFQSQNQEVYLEIARRLSTNTYANGLTVWEEVFMEKEQNLSFHKETFQLVLQAGNGFFGRSREENVQFLEKSIIELEECQRRMKEKDLQERKVWVPVGLLGALMIVIILV